MSQGAPTPVKRRSIRPEQRRCVRDSVTRDAAAADRRFARPEKLEIIPEPDGLPLAYSLDNSPCRTPSRISILNALSSEVPLLEGDELLELSSATVAALFVTLGQASIHHRGLGVLFVARLAVDFLRGQTRTLLRIVGQRDQFAVVLLQFFDEM